MILLMDLPPPVHGMSLINEAVYSEVKSNDDCFVINTAPSYAAGYFGRSLWHIFKAFHFMYVLTCLFWLLIRGERTVYRPIYGGGGQIYDVVCLFLVRLFGGVIILHHHSFQYLNSPVPLTRALFKIAGEGCLHFVLGEKMKAFLSETYLIPSPAIVVLSNIAFFDVLNIDVRKRKSAGSQVRIGHLANLCIEKGVDTFLEVAALHNRDNEDSEFVLAGPFSDPETKLLVEAAVSQGIVTYLGPLYGDDKLAFFFDLDCFLFPSRYINEAEPLVLYEAAQFGCMLFGTDKGCMRDVITSLDGCVFPAARDATSNAEEIAKALSDATYEGRFGKSSRAMRKSKFEMCRNVALSTKEFLFKRLGEA